MDFFLNVQKKNKQTRISFKINISSNQSNCNEYIYIYTYCRLMLWRFLKKNLIQKSTQIFPICSMSSLSSKEIFTNELVRQRLTPYLDKIPNYVDELSQSLPRLKRSRRASVLVPLYCNEITNRIEVLLIKRSEKMRSHTGMIG